MPKSKKTFLKIYLFFYICFIIYRSSVIWNTSSGEYIYLRTLAAFHKFYFIYYYFTFMQVILDFVHILPMYLYINNKRLFHPILWMNLFLLRIIFEFAGNYYAMNQLSALRLDYPVISLIVVFLSSMIYLPSYIISFLYAFSDTRMTAGRTYNL